MCSVLLAQEAPRPGEIVVRAYPVAAGELNRTVADLARRYANRPEIRIAGDERTAQVLVVAPEAVQAEVAQSLTASSTPAAPVPTATPPAASASPVANPSIPTLTPTHLSGPVTRTILLERTAWAQIESSLRSASGGRLSASTTTGQASTSVLSLPAGGALRFSADLVSNAVTIEGDAAQVDRCVRLIEALDDPQRLAAGRTRVVPVGHVPGQPLSRAMAAVDSVNKPVAGPQAAANPAAVNPAAAPNMNPLVARLFPQREAAKDVTPAVANQPAGAPQQPSVKTEIRPGEPLGTGLVGPVQIEFLDGLDIMIISGNERDVERVTRIIEDIERLSVETEPVIDMYPMQHVGSEAMAGIVRQLYDEVLSARQGRVSITALVKPNALLLIGRQENIQAVKELIVRLDQPVDPSTQFTVFRLRHAAAAAVQSTVQQFFATRTGLGGRVVATVDFRTNAVIVQASPRDVAEVAALVAKLDTPASDAVSELRVFPLQNSLAEELAPVLQAAITGAAGTSTTGGAGRAGGAQQPGGQAQNFQNLAQGFNQQFGGGATQQPQQQAAGAAGSQQQLQAKSTMLQFMTIDSEGGRQLRSGILTDVRITADPRANALLVAAPADALELIEALIRELDQIPAAESQIKVFTIVNGDASNLVQMLQSLFGGAGQRTGGAGGFGGGAAAQSFQGETPLVSLRFSVDQRTNTIIASGSSGDLNVVEAILLRLDESDVRQRQNIVYRLKNSPALDVANTINEFLRSEREVQNLQPATLSPFEQIEREVIVVPEIVSNSLIVSATPRYFAEIKRIVEELDARPPMVMIQVLIAQVGLSNTDEFGVEVGLQDSVLFDRSLLGDLITTTNSTQQPQGNTVITTTNQIIQGASLTPGFQFISPTLPNSGSDQSRSTASRVGGQGFSNFAVGRTNSDLGFGGLVLSASSESVSFLMRALQECRRLEVLSRPQIMTLDNQPAFIQVGSRVPRVNGVTINQLGQVNNVNDVNVGLILGVTPRISPDGLVVMEIDAEKSALGPESEGIPISVSNNGDVVRQPIINTTTAQTTVSAANGQTVVLGGLITKDKTVVHRRVPVLASVPILGNMFRYDMEHIQRSELLIIMTPHIIKSDHDADVVKQVEAARMSWCLSDVRKLHGDAGLRGRSDHWSNTETIVVQPDVNPSGTEMVPTPDPMSTTPTLPLPPNSPDAPIQSQPPVIHQAPPRLVPPQSSDSSSNTPPREPATLQFRGPVPTAANPQEGEARRGS